jgi:hypothetical protein
MPAAKRVKNTPSSRSTKITKTNLGAFVRRTVMDIEEKKYFNHAPTTAALTVPNTLWGIYGLLYDNANNGIIQGTAATQRVGNRIKLTGIDLFVKIEPLQGGIASDANASMCRFVVVHQKKNNGAKPTAAQIFMSVDTTPTGGDPAIDSLQNPVYEHRLTIHQDIVHNMVFTGQTVAAANTAGPEGLYRIHIPAKSIVEYNASTGGEAALVSDAWYLAVLSDGSACCNITTNCIVRYVDA